MERKRYDLLLEAVTPVAHHEEVLGNEAVLMRRKVRHAGCWARVPVITADTMRHGLREAAAWATLDAAGLTGRETLSEGALRLLFAGGMLTGRGDGAVVSLDRYREAVDLLPALALLGGCADNRVIPGRLAVDDAVLVCAEAGALLPRWIAEAEAPLESCRAAVEDVQRVRMDPALSPLHRGLLTAEARAAVEGRLLASEAAHAGDDAPGADEARSTLMPRRFERVAAGARFAWSLEATCATDLDLDTLHVMLAAFLDGCRVGGKRGTGHGRLRPVAARGLALRRPVEAAETLEVTALVPGVGRVFRAHVAARADRLAAWLREVNA